MLDINGTLIFTIIAVWAMMYFLKSFLFGPVLRISQERHQLTDGAKKESERTLQKAQQLLNEYQEKIKQAKIDAFDISRKQLQVFQEQKQALLLKAKNEATEKISQALQELDKSIASTELLLQKEAKTIAALIAKQILQRDIQHGESTTK
ncbi:MAG: hypothetical protein A2Y62_20045 [Candidatus Fischerbacteria bacterium RBG_13_37_8]|uniref:ATP synthase subunit b n=1 Tax=Candidatus Fischerbacteria bacterium RBG_13_37_8 TaxID=1817863 RepID=A0A1F5VT67_9BACT|nr:MAG: hypothetical protein A2Y62_20045 [Candidatus Fischerbacteria bacterium RBG_13_37_8]